jgi:hypothetical protein
MPFQLTETVSVPVLVLGCIVVRTVAPLLAVPALSWASH